MSLINEVVWGSVTIETVKSTEVWKKNSDSSGTIPRENFENTLKLALVELGHDTQRSGFIKEFGVNIRSNGSKRVVFNTTVFRFPVRDSFKYKRAYERNEILHHGTENFMGWGISHNRMDDFGNEYCPPNANFNDEHGED